MLILCLLRFTQSLLLFTILLACCTNPMIAGKAQETFGHPLPGTTVNADIEIIERELSRQEPGFQKLCAFPALIPAGTLKLIVSPRELHSYQGQPCCSSLSSLSLLGVRPPPPSPFYGVERVIHYFAFDAFGPAWGQPVQERVRTLYANAEDFDPDGLNFFQSVPFEIGLDGTFDDIQTFGQHDEPPPDSALQLLKQEILIANRLATTLYIVRTPQQIELIGYVEPKENQQQ